MAPSTSHRTPLRRVSHGSLAALGRSGAYPAGPTGLEFLEPAMVELADEAAALSANLESLNALSDSLDAFNESFASYLYVMKMNSLCVAWPQAPTNISFRRVFEDLETVTARPTRSDPNATDCDATTNSLSEPEERQRIEKSFANIQVVQEKTPASDPAPATAPKVRKAAPKKPVLTIREKKARAGKIEKIINLMPLEYRGSDVDLRNAVEGVIIGLMEATSNVRIVDLVKQPTLPQARVNKCLIALVNSKLVTKSSPNGVAMYTLSPLAIEQTQT